MPQVDFVVAGLGDFPLDMLRYDECWPTDAQAVAAMQTPRPRRQVALRTHSFGVTRKRWESFNWKVVSVNGEPVEQLAETSHER